MSVTYRAASEKSLGKRTYRFGAHSRVGHRWPESLASLCKVVDLLDVTKREAFEDSSDLVCGLRTCSGYVAPALYVHVCVYLSCLQSDSLRERVQTPENVNKNNKIKDSNACYSQVFTIYIYWNKKSI